MLRLLLRTAHKPRLPSCLLKLSRQLSVVCLKLQMQQLFEELVLPFVQSHGQACSVLLGGKQPEELGEEAARELLWPVRAKLAAS
jgi:hypothetical protein